MKIYVLDASAVVEFLSKGIHFGKVAPLMKKAANGEAQLLISLVNWGEVLYSMARSVGLSRATSDLKALGAYVEPIVVDEAAVEAAAAVRLHYRLGYADCFAAALAMRVNATLVTTDPDFSKLGKRLKILALPR